MLHLHHQVADLGLQLLVLGFELSFPIRWTIDQRVVSILSAPTFQHAVRQLIVARGLRHAQLPRFDLCDELAFEIDVELSTNLSHCEYRSPRPRTKPIGGRQRLWKMPQLWKSTKVAFGRFFLMISTSCLEKPPQKTLRLSHIYHSPGCGYSNSTSLSARGRYADRPILARMENSPVVGAQSTDLPRRALFKVARHFLKGAATPPRRPSKEG